MNSYIYLTINLLFSLESMRTDVLASIQGTNASNKGLSQREEKGNSKSFQQ